MPDYNIYDEHGRKIGKIREGLSGGCWLILLVWMGVLVYAMYLTYTNQQHIKNWIGLEVLYGILIAFTLLLIKAN